jgi:hypothetical protein
LHPQDGETVVGVMEDNVLDEAADGFHAGIVALRTNLVAVRKSSS